MVEIIAEVGQTNEGSIDKAIEAATGIIEDAIRRADCYLTENPVTDRVAAEFHNWLENQYEVVRSDGPYDDYPEDADALLSLAFDIAHELSEL